MDFAYSYANSSDEDAADDADLDPGPSWHKRQRMTKEQAQLGIFADDDDSDDESQRADTRRRGGGGRAPPKDFSAPVSFVSAASSSSSRTGAGAEDNNNNNNEYDDDDDDEYDHTEHEQPELSLDDQVMARLGLGLQPKAKAKTSSSKRKPSAPPPPSAPTITRQTPNPFSKSSSTSTSTSTSNPPPPPSNSPPGYSSFTSSSARPDKDFGKWQKHTSGIGMKLLQKMNWKPGQGLGIKKQGITRPVEVKLRAKNQALQDDGERTKQSLEDFGAPADEQAKEDDAFFQQLRQWQVKPSARRTSRRRPKYKFKTAEEVAAEAAAAPAAAPPQPEPMKIIDMTAPPAAQIATPHPELQHNLKLLADLAANDVRRLSSQLQAHRNSVTGLTSELAHTRTQVQREAAHINTLEAILAAVARLHAAHPTLTLDDAADLFQQLQTQHPHEYVVYGLEDLALAVALPLLRAAVFAGWQPLAAPAAVVPALTTWRRLLAPAGYAHAVRTLVLPPVRTALVQQWDVHNPAPALALVEALEPVLPAPIRSTMASQLLTPKLRHAVDAWLPTTDPLPLHTWLHPWLPVLPSLDSTFPIIRGKLARVLQGWDPRDASAHAVVAPWAGVWPDKDMRAFLRRAVVPKLELAADALLVDPANQDWAALECVTIWADLLGPEDSARILAAAVFPKLFNVLCQWLGVGDSVDYDEIVEWYMAWKERLSAGKALEQADARQWLVRMLQVMLRGADAEAADAMGVDSAAVARPPRPSAPVAAPSASASAPTSTITTPSSARAVLEELALQHDIVFAPKAGRSTDDGKPLFSFGRLLLFIDNNVVYIKDAADAATSTGRPGWRPVSYNDLPDLERHRR